MINYNSSALASGGGAFVDRADKRHRAVSVSYPTVLDVDLCESLLDLGIEERDIYSHFVRIWGLIQRTKASVNEAPKLVDNFVRELECCSTLRVGTPESVVAYRAHLLFMVIKTSIVLGSDLHRYSVLAGVYNFVIFYPHPPVIFAHHYGQLYGQ